MNSLLLYLLQSGLGLLLFYGFYRLVLRRERSFRFNRFYLLLTPLLAFTLPLLRIPVAVPEPVAEVTWVYALPAYAPTVVVAAPEEEAFPWLTWPNALLLLYAAGALFFAFRLLRQLGFVRGLLQRHREQAFSWQECTVVPTGGHSPTFSFLRYIFWNDHPPVSQAEREQILAHERVHVVQRHSLDLLYLSVLHILSWFNPLLLLYLRALTDTHEYLADQQAVRHTTVDRYAQLMVRQLFHDLNRPVFHPFASSKTLNRIAMLQNPASTPKLWKQLLVLPVLALSVVLFAFQRSPLMEQTPLVNAGLFSEESQPYEQYQVETLNDSSKSRRFNPAILVSDDPLTKSLLNPTSNKDFSQPVTYRGDFEALSKFMGQNSNLITALKQGPGSRVTVSLVVKEDGTLSDVSVKESSRPDVEQAALKAVRATAGNWNPAIQNGKPISTTITLLFSGIKPDDSKANPNAWALIMNVVQEEKAFSWVEQMPIFREGNADLMKFLGEKIQYPEAARKEGISGLTVLSFTVETNGTISDIEVVKKLAPELDAEAVRVVKMMSGEWKPGMQDGKPVPLKFTLPIRFNSDQPSPPFHIDKSIELHPEVETSLLKFIGQNIRYPKTAVDQRVEGLVLVNFVLSPEGTIQQMAIAQKLHPDLDKEAMGVVRAALVKWAISDIEGPAGPKLFTLPVRFALKYSSPQPPSPQPKVSPTLPTGKFIPEVVVVAYPPESKTTVVTVQEILRDKMPEFKGGSQEMMKFLSQNIKYPREARKNRVQGLAIVEFFVHEDGSLSEVKVAKGVEESIDQEALRVMQATSGKWEPATRNGQPIKVKMTVPIRFDLGQPEEPAKPTETATPSPQTAPSFRSGPDELNRHIRQRITFASPTSKRPVDGFVKISFVVNPDGTLSQVKMVDRKFKNIKVVGESSMKYMDPKEFDGGQRKLINDLTQQALEAVRGTSGQWTPAQKNGKAEKAAFILEIPIKYP